MDCLCVGYFDEPFEALAIGAMSRGPETPDSRMFSRDQIKIAGRPTPYLDVLTDFVNDGVPGSGRYHLGEVPNMAGVYLSSFLRKRGFEASFVSMLPAEAQRFDDLVANSPPKFIAITTTFYVSPHPVKAVIRWIKNRGVDCPIVVGGPYVHNLVTRATPDAIRYIMEFIGADVYVFETQGEDTLCQITAAITKGRSLEDIPNCFVRSGASYVETVRRAENNPVEDGSILWESFDSSEIGETAQLRTARSCAFKCAFCDYPQRAGALSLASVEVVEGELESLARRGIKNLVFIDDTFNVPLPRFEALCRMMRDRNFGFRWFSYFRCGNVTGDHVFDLMAESGCQGVFLGLESAEDLVLANMNKKASREAYLHGTRELNRRGIMTFASLIVGFPGETHETISRTIDFLNEAQPTFYRAKPLWYNRHAPIANRADEFGIVGHGYIWRHKTMDIFEALDANDEIFKKVTGSIWMPMHMFDFWALPYLLGKGMTPAKFTEFMSRSGSIMREQFEGKETTDSEFGLRHFCRDLGMRPSRLPLHGH